MCSQFCLSLRLYKSRLFRVVDAPATLFCPEDFLCDVGNRWFDWNEGPLLVFAGFRTAFPCLGIESRVDVFSLFWTGLSLALCAAMIAFRSDRLLKIDWDVIACEKMIRDTKS
jgi:hypothetical protein